VAYKIIEPLMQSPRSDGLLVPCKAARFSWPTVSMILQKRFANHSISDQELEKAKADYIRLSQATAQRTLRFWQVRSQVGK
jgi:hypothetical protein